MSSQALAWRSPLKSTRHILLTWVVGYFATLNMTKVPYRHFVPLRLRGGRAPFVAMRHFPRFSGGIYPEGGSKISRHSERSEESHRRTDGHILLTWVVGYFAYAQYDKSPLSALRATSPEGGSEYKFRVIIKFSLILTKTFFLLPPSGEVSAKPTIGDKSPL